MLALEQSPPGLVKQAINAGPGQAASENARRAYIPPYHKKPKEKALAGRGSAGELPERESWQLFFCIVGLCVNVKFFC